MKKAEEEKALFYTVAGRRCQPKINQFRIKTQAKSVINSAGLCNFQV